MPKRKQPTSPNVSHPKLARTLVQARAKHALEDDEDLERQATALVEQLGYATSGKRQSDSGRESPGRRGVYQRKRKTTTDDVPDRITREELRRDVEELREKDRKRYPPNGSRTFSDVCRDVASKYGYAQSAKAVKKAAKNIQWPARDDTTSNRLTGTATNVEVTACYLHLCA